MLTAATCLSSLAMGLAETAGDVGSVSILSASVGALSSAVSVGDSEGAGGSSS